jgi:hypothetical protein
MRFPWITLSRGETLLLEQLNLYEESRLNEMERRDRIFCWEIDRFMVS